AWDPVEGGGERSDEVGAQRRVDGDPRRVPNDLEDLAGDRVDLVVVGGHAIGHDDVVDPAHVPVPAAEVVRQEVQHRLPEPELAAEADADEEGGRRAKTD